MKSKETKEAKLQKQETLRRKSRLEEKTSKDKPLMFDDYGSILNSLVNIKQDAISEAYDFTKSLVVHADKAKQNLE